MTLMLILATISPVLAAKITMYVKESTLKCVGSNNQCLMVRYSTQSAWEMLPEAIEGFQHEEGYRYQLLVDKVKRKNQNSYRYKLIKIVSSNLMKSKKDPNFTYVKSQEWHLLSFENKDLAVSNILLRFDSMRPQIFLKGDCNNYFGTYTLQDQNITFGPLAGTRKACGEQTHDQALINKLSSKTITYVIEKNKLTLYHNQQKIAVFVNKNYSGIITYLAKYTWKLATLNGKEVTSISRPTIQFDAEENTVSGFSGCNNYGGNVLFSTNGISFDKIISTMRGCLDKDQVEMEAAMHKMFNDKDLTMDVADQALNIYKNNQLIMMFVRGLKKIR